MVEQCDVDEFIVLYIKTQIEHDSKYEWYEAPVISASGSCEKCATVRRAADYFEKQKIGSLKPMLNSLIDRDRLTYYGYRQIFENFISLLSERMDDDATENHASEYSPLCFPLMAIIAFTGIYARRLAELDFAGDASADPPLRLQDSIIDESDDAVRRRRDYRREISRLSIYASHTLRSKFAEFDKKYDYPWDKFVEDTRQWLAYVECCATGRSHGKTGGILVLFGATVLIGMLAMRYHSTLTRCLTSS